MAFHVQDSWLHNCSQELQLPGSPWHEVKELVSRCLVERIRQEGFTKDELAKLSYLLGQEFIVKYKLVKSESFPDVKRPNLSDEKLESVLKDLTLKSAKDAKCFLQKDLTESPECFKNMVSMVTTVFDSSVHSHMHAMRMTQFRQFGSNTSVMALNSLLEKDIEIVGEAAVRILQKEPLRLNNVSKQLRGRLLPTALRRLMYRLVLIKKQKQSGYPGSNLGLGVLSYDEKITFQGLREGFAKGTKMGLKELKSKDPMKSPLQHLIRLAVIQAYETLPGMKPHSQNMEIQKECSEVLNILYTHSRSFRRSFILWVFPLQLTLSEDRFAKEHSYELAMWLNCIIKSCVRLDGKRLNSMVLETWKSIVDGSYDSLRSLDLNQLFSKLGVKTDLESVKTLLDIEVSSFDIREAAFRELVLASGASLDSGSSFSAAQWTVVHPVLCLREWITHLFVGVTDLPVMIFLWDQFFLFNWEVSALRVACAAMFHAMQDMVLKSSTVESLCSNLLERAVDVKLYQIHRAWSAVCLEKTGG